MLCFIKPHINNKLQSINDVFITRINNFLYLFTIKFTVYTGS